MDADDPDMCETCGLRWGGIGSHPPCLSLSPEERRAVGALSASPTGPAKEKGSPEAL